MTADWSRIFSRQRKVAPRQPRVTTLLPLKELALRALADSLDEFALDATVEESLEVADAMSDWPPDLYEIVLPRLGHRMLIACRVPVATPGKRTSLRTSVSDKLLDAAIRREEQAYREARAAEMDTTWPLLSVFEEWGQLLNAMEPPALEQAQLLFASQRERHALPLSAPVIEPSYQDFHDNFDAFSGGLLHGLDFSNLLVAGGSVLACVLATPFTPLRAGVTEDEIDRRLVARREYFEPRDHGLFRSGCSPGASPSLSLPASPFAGSSDVDIFLVGLTPAEAAEKVRHVQRIVKRNHRGRVLAIATESAVTFACGFPTRHIQVVLKIFDSDRDVLSSFDVDACAFGWSRGERVVASARAMRAVATRCNLIDLSRRSVTYESRLLKYAVRGFAIGSDASIYQPDRVDMDTLGLQGLVTIFQRVRSWHYPSLPAAKELLQKEEEVPNRGLARLLLSDMVSAERKVVGSSIAQPATAEDANIAKPVPPVSLVGEWLRATREGRSYQTKAHGLNPQDSTRSWRRGSRTSSGDEWFNTLEADDQSADEKETMKPALYSQGALPWRVGWDTKRIEADLEMARKRGQNFREEVASGAWGPSPRDLELAQQRFTMTTLRSSTLPSEHVRAWNTDVAELLSAGNFVRANRCQSFFPAPAAGFSDGVHAHEALAGEMWELIYKPTSHVTSAGPWQEGSYALVDHTKFSGSFATEAGLLLKQRSGQPARVVKVEALHKREGVQYHHIENYTVRPLLLAELHKHKNDVEMDALTVKTHDLSPINPLFQVLMLLTEGKALAPRTVMLAGSICGAYKPSDLEATATQCGFIIRHLIPQAEYESTLAAIDKLNTDPLLRFIMGGAPFLSLRRREAKLATPPPPPRGFRVGDSVRLIKLSKASYNGLRGTVVGPIAQGRYPVEVRIVDPYVAGGGAKVDTRGLKVKIENLLAADAL